MSSCAHYLEMKPKYYTYERFSCQRRHLEPESWGKEADDDLASLLGICNVIHLFNTFYEYDLLTVANFTIRALWEGSALGSYRGLFCFFGE